MNEEEYIRSKLDGKFFRLDPNRERTSCTKVPLDYIPDHKPSWNSDEYAASGKIGGNTRGREWTDEEDNQLINLRAEGERWQNIGRAMRRADKTVRLRYIELCRQRGIVPVQSVQVEKTPLSTEVKSAIVTLRRKGWDYESIGVEVGLSWLKVRDYFARYLRDRKLSGVAP